MNFRTRKQRFTGKLVVQSFTGGAWCDVTHANGLELITSRELDELRVRVAQADRRADAQRKAHAARKAAQQPAEQSAQPEGV